MDFLNNSCSSSYIYSELLFISITSSNESLSVTAKYNIDDKKRGKSFFEMLIRYSIDSLSTV